MSTRPRPAHLALVAISLAALLAAFVMLGGANAPLIAIAPALVLWGALVASRIHRKIRRTAEVPALAEVELGWAKVVSGMLMWSGATR